MSNNKKVPTFCITGALKMKRIDAIVLIHNKTNARFVSMVSKNTDYLISSRKDTNKAARAKKFGTQIIDDPCIMSWKNINLTRIDFHYEERNQQIVLS